MTMAEKEQEAHAENNEQESAESQPLSQFELDKVVGGNSANRFEDDWYSHDEDYPSSGASHPTGSGPW